MGKDVDATQSLECRLGKSFTACGRRQVRLDELNAVDDLKGSAGRGDHSGAASQETVDGGAAQTFGAATDEHAFSGELGRISLAAHSVISRALIAPFASVKL